MSAALAGLLLFGQATTAAPDAFQRVRARVSVVPAAQSVRELAGKYTSASEELARHWGGGHLSGEELHLFPDGTYIYCEWADVEPLTVYDRGVWHLDAPLIRLVSDPDVTWDPSAERRYVAVRRPGPKDDALLVGLERALPNFESDSGDDPAFSLLVVGLLRTERYTPNAATRVKAKLLQMASKAK